MNWHGHSVRRKALQVEPQAASARPHSAGGRD